MIKIKIDNIHIISEAGTAIIDAARDAGIHIPSMCYKKGYSNHPSCMICSVKDIKTGKILPSCAVKVTDGMEISTTDDDVVNVRKEALELLLSDHVGDCQAPCQLTCPALMDIPLMNRLIASANLVEAIQVVKEAIALPLILGYICPAPCEKACRRGQIDKPVSICLLKKFIADEDLKNRAPYLPKKQESSGKGIAIIGTGPAGLSAAFYLLKNGHRVVLFDKKELPGGSLRYQDMEHPLPVEALDKELGFLKSYGAIFELNRLVDAAFYTSEILNKFDAVVFATGDYDENNFAGFGLEASKNGLVINKDTYQGNPKKVFACGNVTRSRRMAIHSLAQGKIAADSVNAFLAGNEPLQKKPKFNSKFTKLFESEFHVCLKESTSNSRIEPIDGRLGNFSKEEAILEAKRCLHCDCRKLDNCKLRDYADEYDADRKKFLLGERKSIKKYDQHESVIYEPEKCIRCNLCVDITTKNNEHIGLSSIGRGFMVEINIPFNEELGKALTKTAKEVVESCPTGALSFKSGLK